MRVRGKQDRAKSLLIRTFVIARKKKKRSQSCMNIPIVNSGKTIMKGASGAWEAGNARVRANWKKNDIDRHASIPLPGRGEGEKIATSNRAYLRTGRD